MSCLWCLLLIWVARVGTLCILLCMHAEQSFSFATDIYIYILYTEVYTSKYTYAWYEVSLNGCFGFASRHTRYLLTLRPKVLSCFSIVEDMLGKMCWCLL